MSLSGDKYRVKGKRIPRVLYHWSPTRNRVSILSKGLRPNSPSVDNEWNPPYLCFSDSPAYGLSLCPHIEEDMDLYEVWPLKRYRVYKRPEYREWRIKDRITKSRFKLIATRKHNEQRTQTEINGRRAISYRQAEAVGV